MNPELVHNPNSATQPSQPDTPKPDLPEFSVLPTPGQQPSTTARKTRHRNGKIARLPKLERDLVSRLLQNGLPYDRIVAALRDLDISVNARNVSNWKTGGGYDEWRHEQEQALALRLQQDALIDHLRQDDPGQLPEVGIQIVATRFSQFMLRADTQLKIIDNPDKYLPLASALCRLSRAMLNRQKYHDSLRLSNHARDNLQVGRDIELVRQLYSAAKTPEIQDPRPDAPPPPSDSSAAPEHSTPNSQPPEAPVPLDAS